MKDNRKHVAPLPADEVQVSYDPPMDFPRVMLYEGVLSDGTPLVNSASTVDATTAAAFARFGIWCIRPDKLVDAYEFGLEALRAINPNIQFWMHIHVDDVWDGESDYQSRYYDIVGDNIWPSETKRSPRIVDEDLQEQLVELWAEFLNNGWFSGAVLDIWSGWPVDEIDYEAAGYATDVAFAAANNAAADAMTVELRKRCPSTILIGNYGPGVTTTTHPNRAYLNGWLRENFPNQNPGSWNTNVVTGAWAMTDDCEKYATPTTGVILTAPATPTSLSATNEKLMRFHCGSACLGWHVHSTGPSDFVYAVPGWSGLSAPTSEHGVDTWAEHWGNWGYIKEFGINRTTGAETGVCNGWLGQPIGDTTSYSAGGALLLQYREFQYGTVICNPNIFGGPHNITLPGSPTRYELVTHATTTWPRAVTAADAVFLLK